MGVLPLDKGGSFMGKFENRIVMKRHFIIWTMLLLCGSFAFGQDNYLWPVALSLDKKAGDDILYRPQDYIGVADGVTQAELNFDRLIICAPLWTPVLCPVDGKITHASIGYSNSFSCSVDVFNQQTGNFEQDSLLFVEWGMSPEKIRYMNTWVSIRVSDGREVHVSGMRPLRLFKTGETVHRGDVLGTVGYYSLNRTEQQMPTVTLFARYVFKGGDRKMTQIEERESLMESESNVEQRK